MLLMEIQENSGWILSRWNLTYSVGWENICKAVYSVYDFYMQPEVLINDREVKIHHKDNIMTLRESGNLTIRGVSTILKVPVMISFLNQTSVVEVDVAQATEEFTKTDYQRFNMSLGQYMDSIELAMYR